MFKRLLGLIVVVALMFSGNIGEVAASAQMGAGDNIQETKQKETNYYQTYYQLQNFFAKKSFNKYNWQQRTQEPQNNQEMNVPKQPVNNAPVEPQKPQVNETNKETTNQEATNLNEFEKRVVALTNVERTKNGLGELAIDEALSKVARLKSEDMKAKQYFSHDSPTYGSPFDMMKQFNVSYRAAGENIARGQTTPEEVVNAWMNSPGHRANILNGNFTHIGVGFVDGGNYWTQQFIGK